MGVGGPTQIFGILRDSKFEGRGGGGWYLLQVYGVTVKKSANHQTEVLSAIAFQTSEWHAIDDVDFDDKEGDSPEIVHESGTL